MSRTAIRISGGDAETIATGLGAKIDARLKLGLDHSGVIYVSARFRQNDIGAIARALVTLWRSENKADWVNRIHFLDHP